MFKFTNVIILDLTEGCNLNCDYCLMLDKDKHKNEVMDFELFKKIINKIVHQRQLQGNEQSRLTLVFHGGEAFTVGHENFYKFAEYAYTAFTNAGLLFNLGTQTNGTLLDDTYLKILKKFEFSVGLSLDDLGAGNDYRIVNSADFFEKKLDLISKNGIEPNVIAVITDKNIDTLPSFMNKITEEKKGNYTILPVENPTKDVNYKAPINKILRIYYKIIEDFIEGKKSDHKISNTVAMTLVDMLTHHKEVFRSGCGGKVCGIAMGMISARPDGWLGNCDRITNEVEFNNLIRVDTFDFLTATQLKRAVYLAKEKHDLIKDKGCDTCRADYICSHGCMLFHYPETGKFSIEDEVCITHKGIYDYVKNNFYRFMEILAQDNRTIASTEVVYDFKKDVLNDLLEKGIKVTLNKEENTLLVSKEN